MGQAILRPNGTLSTGPASWLGSSLHVAVGDALDGTYASAPVGGYSPPYYGNGATTALPTVSMQDYTTGFPTDRRIISIVFWLRGAKNTGANGFGQGACSFRLSTNAEVSNLVTDYDPANSGAIQSISSGALTTNPVSGQPWAFSEIDGIKCVIGSEYGASQSPGNVYDVWMVVNYSDLPVAPTAVTPATGATITVPNPALGGTMSAIASGQSQKMEWQFATDTGFTANVKTVTEANADLRASGATTESPTIANLALTNGTWYMRARAIDQYGIAGPYSATATLTVNVPALPVPTAVTPAAGATVTTMQPVLGATFAADAAGRTQKGEWQLATDSGFTANVRSVLELDADLRASGATTETLPLSSKITSDLGTTWYVRARSVGQDGTTSAWSAAQSFTLAMAAPPAPTAISPVDGATLITNTPTLGATLGAASENRTVKAEWQFATDSGFTANVRTITESNADLRTSGATTEVIPTGSKLFQTTWYMRAREIDQYGQAGAYSATTSFTVAHQPTAAPTSPISDAKILYQSTAFTWTFSDPASGDAQTAYQLVVERNDTGAVVYDTAKVASTALTRTLTTANLGSLKDVKLRWKVRVWDADDVVGNYSPYQLFTLSDLPVVTITSPTAGQQVTTGQPAVTWTVDAATNQISRQVVFKDASGAIVYDSGMGNTASLNFVPPVVILQNLNNYTVTVTVIDQNNMTGSAVRSFSTLYQVPPTVVFTVDGTTYDDSGYMNIDWSTQSPDGFFVDWRVYRKRSTATQWELVYVTNNQSISSYRDWTASSGDVWQYAVTQTAGRSGAILESVLAASAGTLAAGTHYWLIDPITSANNLRISQVVSDSYSDDYEEAELIIIGRGRKVNQGTRYGYSGTIKAQFRDDSRGTARAKRIQLQLLKDAKTSYYLRNPFGDVLEISLSNIQIERIAGVGTAEFVDVTIPYKEVF